MRSASNPGNIGHDWVKQRFVVEGAEYDRPFFPAKLLDNPYLNAETYVQSLAQLDPITRKQYLDGDWTARQGGSKFKREWFELVDNPAPADAARVRYWDMAATTDKRGGDPDYTVGAKVAVDKGIYYLEDIQRFRERPAIVEARIRQTAQIDFDLHGHNCQVWMECEPGSAGISMIDHYARNILVGFNFRGHKVTGDKEVRANPMSSAAEQGNVKLVRGTWIGAFLDEAESFPLGSHDDQIDAASGAFDALRLAAPVIAFTGEVPY
jgi:predicted phage terminase large subunit-like protein